MSAKNSRNTGRGFWLAATCGGLCLWWTGCSSTPPPAPVPLARSQAVRVAEDAARLSAAENWTAAVRQWQAAADRYALLNDATNEAVAWHNLGQAQQERGEYTLAREALERAAAMNQRLDQTNAWWRNQLALAQLEAAAGETSAVGSRLTRLRGRPVPEPLRAYYANERGRYETDTSQFAAAASSFEEAGQAFQRDRNGEGVAAVAVNRARLLTLQKQYPAAWAAWRQARVAYETLGDTRALALTLLGEGQGRLAAGDDLAQAESLLRQAARNFATLRRPVEQRRALRSLLACLKAQNRPTAAEQAQLDALEAQGPLPETGR